MPREVKLNLTNKFEKRYNTVISKSEAFTNIGCVQSRDYSEIVKHLSLKAAKE